MIAFLFRMTTVFFFSDLREDVLKVFVETNDLILKKKEAIRRTKFYFILFYGLYLSFQTKTILFYLVPIISTFQFYM